MSDNQPSLTLVERNRKTIAFWAFMAAALFAAIAMYFATEKRLSPAESSTLVTTHTYLGPPPVDVQWQDNAAIEVTFIGDSLTLGWGASSPTAGYKQLILDDFARGGVVNPAVTALAGATVALGAQRASIPAETDLLIVELGTNDALPEVNTPTNVFSRQYKDALASFTRTAPSAKLICLGTWTPSDTGGLLDTGIMSACEAVGGTYLHLADLYATQTNRGPAGLPVVGGTSDEFKPNDRGHAAIAQLVLERVQFSSRSEG